MEVPHGKLHKNTIAYENGVVIAQDASCNLYALDAESGKLLWKQYINLDSYPYLTEGVTIDKGVVYAGIGTGLSAYDLKTGQTIWTNKDWKQREGSTTTLTVAGDVLVSGTQWGGLYGNDIRTGKLLWKLSGNGLGNRGASPVYKDGTLWIISSKSFFNIEPKTGKVLQQKSYRPTWTLHPPRSSPNRKLSSAQPTVEFSHWTNLHFSINGK